MDSEIEEIVAVAVEESMEIDAIGCCRENHFRLLLLHKADQLLLFFRIRTPQDLRKLPAHAMNKERNIL
jgi:hypothetical protein